MGGDGGPTVPGTFYVAPTGAGTACSRVEPCSIMQAQVAVRAVTASMQSDIVVELADGIYRLAAPLVFLAALQRIIISLKLGMLTSRSASIRHG